LKNIKIKKMPEGRGGGPHAPPVLRLVSPRARGPAHGVMLRPPCGEKLLETVGVVEGWTPGERPEIWSFFCWEQKLEERKFEHGFVG